MSLRRPGSTELYTLSLHDALPISLAADFVADDAGGRSEHRLAAGVVTGGEFRGQRRDRSLHGVRLAGRSEEHTSELQSQIHLECRLLREKKNTNGSENSPTLYGSS